MQRKGRATPSPRQPQAAGTKDIRSFFAPRQPSQLQATAAPPPSLLRQDTSSSSLSPPPATSSMPRLSSPSVAAGAPSTISRGSPHATLPMSREQTTTPSKKPQLPPHLAFSSSPSILRTPPRTATAPKPHDRSRVIAASDDETSGSDSDSLPDLATIFNRVSPNKMAGRGGDGSPVRTPAAKRVALPALVLSSPMNSRPKFKFDLSELVGHARRSAATEELARRQPDVAAAASAAIGARPTVASADDEDMDGVDESEDGGVRFRDKTLTGGLKISSKVGRAMERTEVKGTGKSTEAWYFFDAKTAAAPAPQPVTFPRAAVAKRPWKMLATAKTEAPESTVAASPWMLTLLSTGAKLPDELFLWILDMAWLGPDTHTRQSCLRVVEQCGGLVRRFLDADRLNDMFLRLGAVPSIEKLRDPKNTEPLGEVTSTIKGAYDGRDWVHLRALLQLLAATAKFLPLKAKLFAGVVLIRMGVDAALMADMDVLFDRDRALGGVLAVVPPKEWDDFCEGICYSIYCAFPSPSLRLAALQRLPLGPSSIPTKDLRQRLAIAFFLDEPQQAGYRPEEVFSLGAISRKVDAHPCFARVNDDTDYAALACAAALLDMAVDDGCAALLGDDEEDRRRFDDEVDALSARLELVGASIYDSGLAHVFRTEAKGAIYAVLRRLESTVRLRPRPRHGHFVVEEPKADPFKQMDLRAFAKKRAIKA